MCKLGSTWFHFESRMFVMCERECVISQDTQGFCFMFHNATLGNFLDLEVLGMCSMSWQSWHRWRFSFVGSRGTSHLIGICGPLPLAFWRRSRVSCWPWYWSSSIHIMTLHGRKKNRGHDGHGDIMSYLYFVVRVYLVMLWLRFHDVQLLKAVHQRIPDWP